MLPATAVQVLDLIQMYVSLLFLPDEGTNAICREDVQNSWWVVQHAFIKVLSTPEY
jgi:hypothetical protein